MDITKETGIATNCNVVESGNGTVESKYDFYKYGNTSEFEHFIDLRDSTVLECINLYLLNKSSKIKNKRASVSKRLKICKSTAKE